MVLKAFLWAAKTRLNYFGVTGERRL
jgi:hypothetical protein